MNLNCCIIGTDTDVGKTHTLKMLVHGLRSLGRRVWVHKPVACGDWQDDQAIDGRVAAQLADPDQDPALVCPLQYPSACSPHLAAAAAQAETSWTDMSALINRLKGDHDLIVEGAGGLLAPLSTDGGTIVDIVKDQQLPCVLVTRPHLGTLNHTQLTVREAQRQGIPILGIIINYHDEHIDLQSIAISTAADQLASLCKVPIIGEIPFAHTLNHSLANTLAEELIRLHAQT